MKYTEPIRKNRDFLKLYRNGKFYVGKIMVIYVKSNKTEKNRLGVTTVKNFGNSVSRNRMRRLIKENYRLSEDKIEKGWDIVFSGRKTVNIPSFKEIEREMKYLFRKTGLIE